MLGNDDGDADVTPQTKTLRDLAVGMRLRQFLGGTGYAREGLGGKVRRKREPHAFADLQLAGAENVANLVLPPLPVEHGQVRRLETSELRQGFQQGAGEPLQV